MTRPVLLSWPAESSGDNCTYPAGGGVVKNLFRDSDTLLLKIAGLCLANHVALQALTDYLSEQGIPIDEDRLADIRREITLGGAGLREMGHGDLAEFLRATQEVVDDLDENEH